MADEMEKNLATKMNLAARKNPDIMNRVRQRQLTGKLNQALSTGNTKKVARLMTGPSPAQIKRNQQETQRRGAG